MADNKATLAPDGSVAIELDVLTPTLGSKVIDVRTLGSQGFYTYDPGFTSTASCEPK
ncbi:citrate (Si)-synthase, partial [Enterobacter hormaechei]|nr:citrate (Si)-synthase [Enterobacter hormaechei]